MPDAVRSVAPDVAGGPLVPGGIVRVLATRHDLRGPLADALTGQPGGERILQDLEQANAFVVSLDAGRSWFRYHQLCADMMQLELRRTAPDELPGLHAAAAGWTELFAASRATASSATVTPRGLEDTVSRIWITRSTVRCGRAGMRLTQASPPMGPDGSCQRNVDHATYLYTDLDPEIRTSQRGQHMAATVSRGITATPPPTRASRPSPVEAIGDR